MFGCICAGRLVQTNLQQVNDTSFVFSIERANEINHLTVFLLGTVPFPDGYGASVHFQFPGRDFVTLGTLTNDRPSSIYRVRPFQPQPQAQDPSLMTATLGIQIVPLDQVQAIAASLKTPGTIDAAGSGSASGTGATNTAGALVRAGTGAGSTDVGRIAEKIVKNLFNYLHSFEGAPQTLTPQTPIPLGVFQKWYEGFLNKIKHDGGSGFLSRED
ncbi:hypothetical protein HD553DRAFT_302146 [Filobasidium floriforme]|uniref:uncharacterized protein n=1 Tax=Filobasidium floriforme TaxID=5210 RepID=UPI001E8CEAA0|nr:uncharacterized protein HD553DRAFT_302146 [Filobasidium floriforme]KAH8090327.1 hypothetical protein HD553DRAFT_302146 [Filobasidium floriforme]